jgi:hypothetical protein
VNLMSTVWVGQMGACVSNLGSPLRRDKDVAEIKVVAVAQGYNAWRGRDLGRTANILILPVFETVLTEDSVSWAPPMIAWRQEIDFFTKAKEFR